MFKMFYKKTDINWTKSFIKKKKNIYLILTDFVGSIYTVKSDFMVGYFFHIAMAARGCTFGIAINAFNLQGKQKLKHYKIITIYILLFNLKYNKSCYQMFFFIRNRSASLGIRVPLLALTDKRVSFFLTF